MIENKVLLEMAGGIFLALYGIHLSGIGLQKILGSHLEETLKKAKGNSLKGLAIGAAATGAIHSSSTTAVMLIGLITGSFMGLSDIIPIVLGANIGSTIATQIASISVQVGSMVFLILSIGVIMHMSAQNKFARQAGEAVIGFGLILLGAQFIFSAAAGISQDAAFMAAMEVLESSPLLAFACGAFFTVILRSVGIVSILAVALGASGAASLSTALFLILGINLGSSLKVLLLALKGKNFSGRLALIHLASNLLGLSISLIFFDSFLYLAEFTSGSPARQIANAHTLYNVFSAIIFMPLIPFAVRMAKKAFPADSYIKKQELSYLDRKLICTPSVSLAQANNGTVEMAKVSYEMLELSKAMLLERKAEFFEGIRLRENRIDDMTEKISEYIIQISQQNLSRDDAMKLYSLMRITADIERLCDHIVDLADIYTEIREGGIVFSDKAKSEITAVYGKLQIIQNLVVKSLGEDNARLAGEVAGHENKVDEIIKKISANHQKRFEDGKCAPEADKYFSGILYHLERIGDHYDNIAYAIIDRFLGGQNA